MTRSNFFSGQFQIAVLSSLLTLTATRGDGTRCGSCDAGGTCDLQVGITEGSHNGCGEGPWISFAFPFQTGGGLVDTITMVHRSNYGTGDLYLMRGTCEGPDVNGIRAMLCQSIKDQPSGEVIAYHFEPLVTSSTEPTWVVAVLESSFAFDIAYNSATLGSVGTSFGNLTGDSEPSAWQDLDIFGYGACYCVDLFFSDYQPPVCGDASCHEEENCRDCPADCSPCSYCEPVEQLRIDAPDAAPFDHFGSSTSASGEWLAAGAPGVDAAGADAGAVYLYRYSEGNWAYVETLLAEGGAAGDAFGSSVFLRDDLLVIGSPLDDSLDEDAGSAHVYRFDGATWNLETILIPEDLLRLDDFGRAVATDGSLVVVGAPLANNPNPGEINSGAAYLFRYDGLQWVVEDRINCILPDSSDDFGVSVAVAEEAVYVGAPHRDGGGAVFVFKDFAGGWNQADAISASDAWAGSLGASLALHEDLLAIGATSSDHQFQDVGSAFVYRLIGGEWTQEAEVISVDPETDDLFGQSVAINGDTLLVGASSAPAGDSSAGAGEAHVFRLVDGQWVHQARVTASDSAAEDQFGVSTTLLDDWAFVGASFHSTSQSEAGSVYAFRGLGDCNGNAVLDICDVEGGGSSDGNENGVPDECEGPNCAGDANGDGVVDPIDSGFVLARLGCDVDGDDRTCLAADVNGDAVVDPLDVGFVLSRLGSCDESS